ncbi:Conserved_hypothetical protein [Hexamita inflata]|uniref:Uncharacterized protein n=1 Tax=Hexamita inflata TaxID=28002 RepID=A0AA86NW55_9EUKA|nr:Conserved hypothetical protein [Hexamita inflata]CAI9945119.1 Conserved hypothetical protein [Hexamita inflata]
MPPKAVKKDYGLADDAGLSLEPEPWMEYFEKKLRLLCKQTNIQPPSELVYTIKQVAETEDKERKGLPFEQLVITTQTQPEQLSSIFTVFMQLATPYIYLKKIVLKDIVLNEANVELMMNFLAKQKSVTSLTLNNNQLIPAAFRILFAELGRSGIINLKIVENPICNEVLVNAGVQIEKCAARALKAAQDQIADAIKVHKEELEKQAQLKTKPKKAKKQKGPEMWQMKPEDVFPSFYVFQTLQLEYCNIQRHHAAALSVFLSKAAPFLSALSLKGNQIGNEGLAAIGHAFEECADRYIGQSIPNEHPIERESYIGCRFIKLQQLDLTCNLIGGDEEEPFKQFGCGVMQAGNLKDISFSQNGIEKNLKWLITGFQKQVALTKVFVPDTCYLTEVQELMTILKTHKKKCDDVAKQLKKIQKDSKKKKPAAAV